MLLRAFPVKFPVVFHVPSSSPHNCPHSGRVHRTNSFRYTTHWSSTPTPTTLGRRTRRRVSHLIPLPLSTFTFQLSTLHSITASTFTTTTMQSTPTDDHIVLYGHPTSRVARNTPSPCTKAWPSTYTCCDVPGTHHQPKNGRNCTHGAGGP